MVDGIIACYVLWLLSAFFAGLALFVVSSLFNIGQEPQIAKSTKCLLVIGIPVALLEVLVPGAASSAFFQNYGLLANFAATAFVIAAVSNLLRGL